MTEELQVTRVLGAPPDEVYRAWTDPEILAKWFAPGPMHAVVAELDAQPGGHFRVEMHNDLEGQIHVVTGTFRHLEPDQGLAFTWTWEGWGDVPETLVSVELRPHGDSQTELTLKHEGFPVAEMRDQHLHGWSGSTLKLAGLWAQVP